MITCICYDTAHKFQTKKQAIDFFMNCAFNSEGSEQSRYLNIVRQLKEGNRFCSDMTTI